MSNREKIEQTKAKIDAGLDEYMKLLEEQNMLRERIANTSDKMRHVSFKNILLSEEYRLLTELK